MGCASAQDANWLLDILHSWHTWGAIQSSKRITEGSSSEKGEMIQEENLEDLEWKKSIGNGKYLGEYNKLFTYWVLHGLKQKLHFW